jgi:hypothetical protein
MLDVGSRKSLAVRRVRWRQLWFPGIGKENQGRDACEPEETRNPTPSHVTALP